MAQRTDTLEERREAVVLRLHEDLFANADTAVLDEHLASDYVEHNAAYGRWGGRTCGRSTAPAA